MTTESVRPVCASCKEEIAKANCYHCLNGHKLRDDGWHEYPSEADGFPALAICESKHIRALPVRPVDSGEREALALAFTLEVRRFLNLDYDQRSYSWHDVVNALDSAKAVVQAGALPPDAPTGTLTAKKLASFIRDNGFVGPDELARRILAAGYRRIDAGEVVVPLKNVDVGAIQYAAALAAPRVTAKEIIAIREAIFTALSAAAKGVGG